MRRRTPSRTVGGPGPGGRRGQEDGRDRQELEDIEVREEVQLPGGRGQDKGECRAEPQTSCLTPLTGRQAAPPGQAVQEVAGVGGGHCCQQPGQVQGGPEGPGGGPGEDRLSPSWTWRGGGKCPGGTLWPGITSC